MVEVLHRKFHEYSGCLVRGTMAVAEPHDDRHMSCAAFLTAQLEAPKFGLVQSYDGAGISGGLLHNVAVLPRDLSQGSLWTLVRRIFDDGYATDARRALVDALWEKKWTVSIDGKVRDDHGVLVGGRELREWIAPPNGKVPKSGPNWEQAKKVAILFHNLLSEHNSFAAQTRYAVEWLCHGSATAELAVYSQFTGRTIDSAIELPASGLPPEVHTAMCVYHSFSVNGPAPAAKALAAVKQRDTKNPLEFGRRLIRNLGKTDFGRWHDQEGDGGSRYDSTRQHVLKYPHLFPSGAELMPRDL